MNEWVFKLLILLWGDWSPSDLILIGIYAGTPMQRTLPFRQWLVCFIVGKHLKKIKADAVD